MSPLTSDEYAVGRRVRDPDTGAEFDIRDSIGGTSGNRYLVVTDPSHDLLGLSVLLPEGQVRDEFESRDPDEVQDEREQEAQERQDRLDAADDEGDDPPAQDPAVTDAPDVTDRQEGTPGPQGTDPANPGNPGTNPSPPANAPQA